MWFPSTEAAVLAIAIGSVGAVLTAVGRRAPPPTALRVLLGPNIGYVFTSPRAWVRISRAVGAAFIALAASIPLQSILLSDACLATATSLELAALTAALTLYARFVGERASVEDPAPDCLTARPIVTPITPFKVWWVTYAGLGLGTAFLIYAVSLARLVRGVFVTHINVWGVPDGFSSSPSMLYSMLVMPVALAVSSVTTIAFSRRMPEVFYRPWLRPETLETIVKCAQASTALAYAYSSGIIAYALSLSAFGASPLPLPALLPLLAAYVAFSAYGVALGLRDYVRFRRKYLRT